MTSYHYSCAEVDHSWTLSKAAYIQISGGEAHTYIWSTHPDSYMQGYTFLPHEPYVHAFYSPAIHKCVCVWLTGLDMYAAHAPPFSRH